MKKATALLLVTIILAMSFAACSSDSPVVDGTAFVGTWNVVEVEEGGEVIGAELIELAGLTAFLVLSEDGTMSMDLMGEVGEGTWKAKNDSTVSITVDGEKIDATLADGRLTLAADETKIIFSKG